MLIQECLIRNKDSKKTAIWVENSFISYKELYERSYALSEILQTDDYSVGLYIENSIDYVIGYFAILFSGRSVILLNTQYKISEIVNILNKCNSHTIITVKKSEIVFNSIEHNIKQIKIDELNFLKNNAKDYNNACSADNTALIIPTSGTTSSSKMVCLSHNNVMANVKSIIDVYDLSQEDNELIVLPLSTAFCNTTQLLTCLYSGITITLQTGSFNPEAIFKTIKERKITYCEMIPSMLHFLSLYYNNGKHDISSLRRITYGGESADAKMMDIVKERFPSVVFLQGYGMTEASPVISSQRYDDIAQKENSVGRILNCISLKIVGDNGKTLIDKDGLIYIKGESLMLGYWNEKPLKREKWFCTGDIGRLDKDGYLYIKGRKKNLVISGGQNIYPEEIENILKSNGNVKEAYVYGVADDALGEVVEAKVVLTQVLASYEKILLEYCKERISDYKIPRRIIAVNELEKTVTNKIRRTNK